MRGAPCNITGSRTNAPGDRQADHKQNKPCKRRTSFWQLKNLPNQGSLIQGADGSYINAGKIIRTAKNPAGRDRTIAPKGLSRAYATLPYERRISRLCTCCFPDVFAGTLKLIRGNGAGIISSRSSALSLSASLPCGSTGTCLEEQGRAAIDSNVPA